MTIAIRFQFSLQKMLEKKRKVIVKCRESCKNPKTAKIVDESKQKIILNKRLTKMLPSLGHVACFADCYIAIKI